MIQTLAYLLFAFAVVLVAGRLLLIAIDPSGELRMGRLSGGSLALLFGLGLLSLQLFFYSVAGVGIGVATVALFWLFAFALFLYVRRSRGARRPLRSFVGAAKVPATRWGVVETLCAVIVLGQLTYSVVYSLALPVTGWDAWSIWFFKARAFFIDNGVTPGFLLNPSYGYAHADYPLLVPLSVTWLYTVLGSADDIAAKALYPVQLLALLSLLYYFVRGSVGRRSALVAVAAGSLVPLILIHSAGLPVKIAGLYSGDFVGYADLTLSLFFMTAGGFIYMYAKEGTAGPFRAAALTLAIGAWTKNEGVVFALAGATVLIAILLLRNLNLPFSAYFFGDKEKGGGGGRAVIAGLLFTVAAFALFILPWAVYKAHLGLGSEYTGGLNIGTVSANIDRLPFVAGSILSYLFMRPSLVNIVWWALLASVALNPKAAARPGTIALLLLIIGQFTVYTLVYVITPADVAWQVSTSLDRLVLHLTPLALLAAALCGGARLER